MRRAAALLGLDAIALVVLWPSVACAGAQLRALATGSAGSDIDEVLGTLAAAALWLAAAWLALGLLVAAAARAPGQLGRIARRLSHVLLPHLVYRLLAGSAGLGVLLAPVAAGAQPSGPSTPPPATGSAVTVAPPTWPVSGGPEGSRPVPTPAWPTGPASTPSRSSAPRVGRTTREKPATRPEGSGPRPATPAAQAPVEVRPGDSLWLIAAHRLGPSPTAAQIAAEWPRWYAANATVVGADPNLIRPGQLLDPPAAADLPGGQR